LHVISRRFFSQKIHRDYSEQRKGEALDSERTKNKNLRRSKTKRYHQTIRGLRWSTNLTFFTSRLKQV